MATFSLIAAIAGTIVQAANPTPVTDSFVTGLPKEGSAVLENGVYHAPSTKPGSSTGKGFISIPERIRRQAKQSTPRYVHDSIVTRFDNGEYNLKEVFSYDENFHPLERNRYAWDTSAKEWTQIGKIACTWDENGLMTSIAETYTSGNGIGGGRNDFYYDGDGDNVETIYLKYENDEWKPKQRGLYMYDENHFVIEAITQNMNSIGEWVNVSKDCAAWTPTGLRTLYESYQWNGNEWYSQSSKNTYEFNEDGQMISYYTFQPYGNGWVNSTRILQEWDGDNLTLQNYEFWNADREDWLGSPERPSLYTTLEYNEQGYKTMEKGFLYDFNLGDWRLNVYFESVFTSSEYGGLNEMMTNYSMEYDMVTETVERRYDRFGNQTYYKQIAKIEADGPMLPLLERYWIYDETGRLLIDEGTYMFSGETRIANAKNTYEYDDAGGMTLQFGEMGRYFMTREGDPEEWMKFSRKEYAFENGMKLKEHNYYWTNGEYVPQYGEENDFNFDVPTSECVYWIDIMPDAEYMLTARRAYNANGNGGWNIDEAKWYYTDVVSNNVENVEIPSLRIYPNPASDFISVEATEGSPVEIFSINGTKIISTTSHNIDVSGLSRGLYIVSVNGNNTRLIKK